MLPGREQISLIIYGGERGTQRGTSARNICVKIIFCGSTIALPLVFPHVLTFKHFSCLDRLCMQTLMK